MCLHLVFRRSPYWEYGNMGTIRWWEANWIMLPSAKLIRNIAFYLKNTVRIYSKWIINCLCTYFSLWLFLTFLWWYGKLLVCKNCLRNYLGSTKLIYKCGTKSISSFIGCALLIPNRYKDSHNLNKAKQKRTTTTKNTMQPWK